MITQPTVEPVSVTELKAHLRLDFDDEDDLLEAYLQASREYFEARTGRTLHQTTLEWFTGSFPNGPLYLPRATPLISVTGAWYTNSGGTETEWTGFVTDVYGDFGNIRPPYGGTYPSFTAYPVNAVRVRYVAGIANASPQTYPKQTIRVAIMQLATGMYQNRESELIPDIPGIEAISLEYGVEALIKMNQVEWQF